ncbi:hypothetical protein [Clostridium sp. Marseille-QA1073]
MKLEDLINEEKELKQVKENVINKINEFKEVCTQLEDLQKKKGEELQIQCMNEAENFLEMENLKLSMIINI